MDKAAAFRKAKVMGAVLDSGILSPFAKRAKDKGVKKEELVSFLKYAMTKQGSAAIIKESSDPELAARVIWAIRIAVRNG